MKNYVVLTATILFGSIVVSHPVTAAPAPVKPEVALKQAYPQLAFDSIAPTDINGLYEVVVGQNILYFFPEKEYLFAGEIYNKDRVSITAEKRKKLGEVAKQKSEKMVADLPLDKAVKIGNGKNVIIEFTDPDCPYCRKASEFLKTQPNVTRYVFFAPFAHPAAIEKVHYILNAKDKAKAYTEMLEKGLPLPGPVDDPAAKALAQEHLALARKLGVQGTPTFFVNGKMVVGADTNQIEQLLKDGKK